MRSQGFYAGSKSPEKTVNIHFGALVSFTSRSYSKSSKRIRAHFKTAFVNPIEEAPKNSVTFLWQVWLQIGQSHGWLSFLGLIIQKHCGNHVELERFP
jgi:hypothetical protein